MKLPPPPRNLGLWDIDGMSVKYLETKWVQFSCEHKVTNGEREIRNVTYTLLDWIRKVDFDAKVEAELQKFIAKMKARNDKILQLRKKTAKAKSTVHNLL